MSGATIAPGCIFHWKDYQFSDGEKANKYFVIVGAKQGCNFLAVIATSKARKRKFEPGCNAKDGYYHIPGGSKDWFPSDTWLLIAEPIELEPKEFVKLSMVDKVIKLQGNLRPDIVGALRNCMKRCDDVSESQLGLL